jgi:A/G-specific adenine glycosylase
MPESIPPDTIKSFRRIIRQYYKHSGRDLPWRNTQNPYHILISEVMLQQTPVERVLEKYAMFLSVFPDFLSLANAPLKKLLSVWQGLGYNRRALALQRIAQEVITKHKGRLPESEEILVTMPGIGKATASALTAFALNAPSVFIETNIRRVFIHCFFRDREGITDAEILPLIEMSLDTSNPRHWYYALMDYGAMLKKQVKNPNRKSAHYQKQPSFHGSFRQIRGMILKEILSKTSVSETVLAKKLTVSPDKIRQALSQLQKEGFIRKQGRRFAIGE